MTVNGEINGTYTKDRARTPSNFSGMDIIQGAGRRNFGSPADDYAQANAVIDALLDTVGDNEDHPLADVLDYFADFMFRLRASTRTS
jgi:hypothetical protein